MLMTFKKKTFLLFEQDFYFRKPGTRRNPSGKLYDRYYNLSRRRNKIKPTSATIIDADDDEEEFNFKELNDIKCSIKNDISSIYLNEKVSDSWKRTFPLRQKDLKESDSNTAFLTNWPAFKEAFGCKLVSNV